jgi:hypothetical protein
MKKPRFLRLAWKSDVLQCLICKKRINATKWGYISYLGHARKCGNPDVDNIIRFNEGRRGPW